MRKKKAILILYIFFILWATLLSRQPRSSRLVTSLLWEVKNHVWVDILINILLFIPLGFLLGISTNSWKSIVYGFLLSTFIEISQYMFLLGYCQADDVLNNTIGNFVGIGVWKMLSVLIGKWKNKRMC